MPSVCLIALLSGAILGLRYRAFVLVPASLAIIGLAAAVEIASGQTIALAGLVCGLAVILLQAGYIGTSSLMEQRTRLMKASSIRRGGLPNRAT